MEWENGEVMLQGRGVENCIEVVVAESEASCNC